MNTGLMNILSPFWKTWLVAFSYVVIGFGVVLATAGFELTRGLAYGVLDLLSQAPAPEPNDTLDFTLGLVGCVTLGWGLTLLGAVRVTPHLTADSVPVLWRLIALSMVVWYVTDSWISVRTGFGLNAVSNTVLTLALLIPIWRCRLLSTAASAVPAGAMSS
ncbi:MAG: hypothetical protein AAF752_03070 [Bacteroidota bacterium]